MGIALEYKKIKRTGIIPGCLAGGFLAALIPVLELAVRSEQYTGLMQPPLRTIFQADWQMMSMLNMLIVITAACMMYHTEYADNAIQRIITLPMREETVYFLKALLLSGMCAGFLAIEMISVSMCTLHWFGGEDGAFTAYYDLPLHEAYLELIQDLLWNLGYCFCMLLPMIFLSLLIASACKNMWISLGVDVVCVFMATMIPVKYFSLAIFPFALPFQILEGAGMGQTVRFLAAGLIEGVVIGAAEIAFLRVRRSLA